MCIDTLYIHIAPRSCSGSPPRTGGGPSGRSCGRGPPNNNNSSSNNNGSSSNDNNHSNNPACIRRSHLTNWSHAYSPKTSDIIKL